MYNLTNAPGTAGMSNASTQPPGLFNNALSRFGQGAQSFAERVGGASGKAQDIMQRLFGNLFGGQGSLTPGPDGGGFPGQGPLLPPESPDHFVGQGGPLSPVLGGGQPDNSARRGFPGAPFNPQPGGGFLSRFMPGGQ
jgi:hypothetical protein